MKKKPLSYEMKLTIERQWMTQLRMMQCWLSGYKEARGYDQKSMIPGEFAITQILANFDRENGE